MKRCPVCFGHIRDTSASRRKTCCSKKCAAVYKHRASPYMIPPARDGWEQDAACRDMGWDTFFPESDEQLQIDWSESREVCAGCEVRVDCLSFAQENHFKDGMFGGMSPSERARFRRGGHTKCGWPGCGRISAHEDGRCARHTREQGAA